MLRKGASCAAVLIFLVLLGGCGIFQIKKEAKASDNWKIDVPSAPITEASGEEEQRETFSDDELVRFRLIKEYYPDFYYSEIYTYTSEQDKKMVFDRETNDDVAQYVSYEATYFAYGMVSYGFDMGAAYNGYGVYFIIDDDTVINIQMTSGVTDSNYDISKNGKPFITPVPDNTEAAYGKPVRLDAGELDFFTDYFNQRENNGFLLSGYSEPSEIDLHELFYAGAGFHNDMSEEEERAFEAASGYEKMTDITKLTRAQVISLLDEKMGVALTLSDIQTLLGWIYIEEYDAFYCMHGDTNRSGFDCIGGYKTSDGRFVVICMGKGGGVERCTVTLRKDGEHYLFVSNELVPSY